MMKSIFQSFVNLIQTKNNDLLFKKTYFREKGIFVQIHDPID